MRSIPTSGFELPDRYEKDLLHLMVRDAHTLFVYWEVGNRKRWLCSQHFECDWGVLPKVLRVYDVTGVYFNGNNAHRHFDIETTPEADRWYIYGVSADTVWTVDFGVYTIRRQFVPLLRSGAVRTPRDSAAPWGAPLQPTVPEAQESGKTPARIRPYDFENFSAYHSWLK
ncbi:DUF4912 domain-containing protein [Paenibacillus elgii]